MAAIVPNPAYSDQFARMAPPAIQVKSSDWGSKLRCSYSKVTYAGTTGTAGVIRLMKLPAGKLRILGFLSRIAGVHSVAALRYDIGYLAHTQEDGTPVVADPNGLASAQDPDTTAVLDETTEIREFDSREGVEVQATIQAGTLTAGDVLRLWLVYQQGN